MLGGLDYHSIAVAVKRALTAFQFGTAQIAANAINAVQLAGSALGFSLVNGTLVPSQNGTQLTVAIKTLAGADPSAADPVYVLFRNVTPGTGDYTVITLTTPTSIQTTVAGTFGVANAVPFRLWVVGFNDGGAFRLALINCLTTVAGAGAGRDVTAIFPLAGWGIASATQIGAGSVSSGVFYSAGAAVAAKAYATLGYLTYEAGLAAAGTFGVNHSRAELFSQNDPLPGQIIQVQRTDTGAAATGTTTIPDDDTIPQNTEGDQYMSQAITPSSAANILSVAILLYMANDVASAYVANTALFQDATANALKAIQALAAASSHRMCMSLNARLLASTTAATTFKVRAGGSTAGTTTFNGILGARKLGGVINSFIHVEELMA